MKKTNDFLPGGPNVSLERLSKFASNEFYTSNDEVLDEKLRLNVLNNSGFKLPMKFLIIVVFAVPDTPTNNTFLF